MTQVCQRGQQIWKLVATELSQLWWDWGWEHTSWWHIFTDRRYNCQEQTGTWWLTDEVHVARISPVIATSVWVSQAAMKQETSGRPNWARIRNGSKYNHRYRWPYSSLKKNTHTCLLSHLNVNDQSHLAAMKMKRRKRNRKMIKLIMNMMLSARVRVTLSWTMVALWSQRALCSQGALLSQRALYHTLTAREYAIINSFSSRISYGLMACWLS